MISLHLDGKSLTIENIYNIAYADSCRVTIDSQAQSRMKKSREFVDQIVKKGEPVYGINTGFGALSEKKIELENLEQLQLNLIRSHCTGVGENFPIGIVRAIMLLRANCLTSGYSGVSLEAVEMLCHFLNHQITPLVPEKGSVGASGDLAPLAHIALCLIGEGSVHYQNQVMTSAQAMKQTNAQPIKLRAKDGLALINGTATMAALGALALYEAEYLVKTCDIISCLTLEAVRGTARAFDSDISRLKPLPGQLAVSRNLLKLVAHSQILNSHEGCGKVQDPYSLRCIPQVHGACRQTLRHAREVLEIEINSVTDNPLIFIEENKVVSGGNFHGEALALCMDYLAMGLAELANIAERRVEKMMNPTFSDLPAFLIKDSGLNSGLMIAHVTMAALVSENKYLCHPASVDSIPTSTDKEDHVSMGVTSGRKLLEVIRNLKNCMAIELLCNTQGIELLRPLSTSPALESVVSVVRTVVEPIITDRVFANDIKAIYKLISKNKILESVELVIGPLE